MSSNQPARQAGRARGEDDEATRHVLRVLGSHGAAHRFGAPLDARWQLMLHLPLPDAHAAREP